MFGTSKSKSINKNANKETSKNSRNVCTSVGKSLLRLRHFINWLPDYDPAKTLALDETSLKKEIYNQSLLCVEKPSSADLFSASCELYSGCGGIAYMFYHMSQSPVFSDRKDELINRCLDILKVCLQIISDRKTNEVADRRGFLMGYNGIYAVAAAAFNATGNKEESEKYINYYKEHIKLIGNDLFVGRAGYICGALWLNKEFRSNVIPNDLLNSLCEEIVKSGRIYSINNYSDLPQCPLIYHYEGIEYLGAAHGLSFILQMLISCNSFLDTHFLAEKEVKKCIDFYLSIQSIEGSFPSVINEVRGQTRDDLVQWCRGAPGMVYLLAKAYLKWNDKRYLDAALLCGEVTWKKGLLKKGPGICHGLAGNGYVFLLLYRITGSQIHYHRAKQFAKFLSASEFVDQAETPDCPFSLYEGFGGTVCFLTDLLHPSTATFPFMDVF